jgi:hypothetical protein
MPPKYWDGTEPRWDEMLDDPVILAMMQRDGVQRESLLGLMTEMRERLEVARASAETAEHWSG